MASQVWATDSLGGFMFAKNLSKTLRMQSQPISKFRQFADVKDATQQGKSKGNLFHWNVFSNLTTRGSAITEDQEMPQSNFTITQGTLTIGEYGISVPYTGKLDDLSEQPVKEIINKVLKFDTARTLDAAAFTEFKKTPLRASGTATDHLAITSNGTAGTNTTALLPYHIKGIVDAMKERNIPGYQGDDYVCLSHPTTFRPLRNALEAVHTYTDAGFKMILNGEIGRYEGVRFVEQNNIPKGGAADSTTFNQYTGVADEWNTAKSSWAFFMGDDTVAEAIAVPEEVRGKIPTDFGRSRGVAWYYLGGFGLVHTQEADSRIVMWDSAV